MNVIKAILLKVASALLFAVMAVLVRYLGANYPVGQVVFFRSAFAIVPVMIIYAWRGELEAAIRTGRPFAHLGRGLTALGSMFMKAAVASVLRRFGYRNVLLYNALISSAFLAACASFVQGMPFAGMIAILLSGGFFRSLQFTAINTIAYAEIEPAKMSRATAMVAAAQQLSLSTGVAVGVTCPISGPD